MQITGIIAEYNPFHNGHAYQLSQAREQTHADYIVVILNGNYKKQLTEQKKYIRIRTERTYVLLRRILWQVKKN